MITFDKEAVIKQLQEYPADVDDLFLAGSSVKRIVCSDGIIKVDE